MPITANCHKSNAIFFMKLGFLIVAIIKPNIRLLAIPLPDYMGQKIISSREVYKILRAKNG